MALPFEQPFHEPELRFFLAEILKNSSIPPADLVKIIQDRSIQPEWDSMALPYGRSVASCRNQFSLLTNRVSSVLAPGPLGQPPGVPKPKKKRSSGSLTQQPAAEGLLQPQQYQFAPINEPSNPAAFQGVQLPPGEASERAGKKRGRPSKAEREFREAEARARGEVYQPTKRKPKTPRPSTEGAEGGDSGGTSGSKKQAKKQKTSLGPMGPAGEPLSGEGFFQASASPTEQMQVDTPERQQRETMPESLPPQSSAGGNLLAGMQEHAAQAGARDLAAPSPSATSPSAMGMQQGSSRETQLGQPVVSEQESIQPPEAKMT